MGRFSKACAWMRARAPNLRGGAGSGSTHVRGEIAERSTAHGSALLAAPFPNGDPRCGVAVANTPASVAS